MKFGVFYEHQLPRPWVEGSEQQLFQDALSQVELADRLGIDYAWEVEHHFLEEYSHSSAPEVFSPPPPSGPGASAWATASS
jgi:alkanesulfonate monooxygenase SsuD/methylene tetrahydromethanopterin reductase-like flavin-dependent oxidoreductase (luciferase family)